MTAQRTADSTVRIVLLVLGVIVLAPLLMMIIAIPMIGLWGGMMGGFGGSGMGPLLGVGTSLVWLLLLLGGGYLGYRWLVGSGSLTRDTALEELRLAYARGDLTDEEFETRRAKLSEE